MLLKSANLSEQHEQLAKATASDLKCDVMKDQLKKIFGDLSCIPPTSSSVSQAQVEDINQVDDHQEVNPTMYQSYKGKYQQSRGGRNRTHGRGRSGGRGQGQYAFSHKGKPKRGTNPLDDDGNLTRCSICESINHWAQSCPDKGNKDISTYYVVLFQADYDHPSKLKGKLLNLGIQLCLIVKQAKQYVDKHG